MSSALKPNASDNASGRTDEARAYKKTFQEVGRPGVTDHDINEEYMRDPPQNVPADAQRGGTEPGMKAPKDDEMYGGGPPDGVMGEDVVSRKAKLTVQEELLDSSEASYRQRRSDL